MHDHHLHLFAAAAALTSADCSPARARDRDGLARALRAQPADACGWVRGVGYFESVAGALDRAALDAIEPSRPLRVQHRSGQLWMLNTAALERLGATAQHPTGRVLRADRWLRERLGPSDPPSLAEISRRLSERGVRRVTDATHTNGPEAVAAFAAARARGELAQEVVVMGTLALGAVAPPPGVAIGPLKIHLAEAALPDFDDAVAAIRAAHAQRRNAAIHVVTRAELVFALAAYEAAGVRPGDRLEHVHVAPAACVEAIARLGLAVCANAALVAERRAEWERALDPRDAAAIVDVAALARAGVRVLHASDAPYGPLLDACGAHARPGQSAPHAAPSR
ncbi:MAG: hydrolase [Proteobacteria bacterium]|nr:MAG: hydrolase [Pseudomonadota bacterium]